MSARIVVLSAGLSTPSSTRTLADRLTSAVDASFRDRGEPAGIEVFELRDHAHAIVDTMLTGFAPPPLDALIRSVTAADGLIVVTPVFAASYSGLFKSFFDVLDREALRGTPVLVGATAGTERHSLAIDFAIRPLLTHLHAEPVPTAVFAASRDWGVPDGAVELLSERIGRAASELVSAVTGRPGRDAGSPSSPVASSQGGASFEDLLRRFGQEPPAVR